MKTSKIILALFIVQILCLFVPQTGFCQTETLDIIQYTPPAGWTKTPKEGAMVYLDVNKTTNGFCILTVYRASPSTGNPNTDFVNEWNALVVKPFKAEAGPKTETQTNAEGWQATVGGSEIEMNGTKSIALLTVFSGFGKTASILAILNDQSYLAQADAFIAGIKLDKSTAALSDPATQKVPDPAGSSSDYLGFDPFPDKPHFQAQQPLIGRLRKTITMSDLAGKWEISGASIQEYVSSSTQSQTSTSFGRTDYTIRADGTYESKSQSRASSTTIRESESGTIILSGGFIIKKSSNNREMKYQFVSFMDQPNGAAVLTMIYLGDNPLLDAQALRDNCGHAHGYVTCSSGEVWVRIP